MPSFGPQLIGATEKTLNALLCRLLADTGLTEPQWVTMRLAGQNSQDADLVQLVTDRAYFTDAAGLVSALTERGLILGNRLTGDGQAVVDKLQSLIAATAAPIWADLASDDVAATERVLSTVLGRARSIVERLG
jgi:hypothetical protein